MIANIIDTEKVNKKVKRDKKVKKVKKNNHNPEGLIQSVIRKPVKKMSIATGNQLEAIYKSVKQNYIFYIVLLCCLYAFTKCTYNRSSFILSLISIGLFQVSVLLLMDSFSKNELILSIFVVSYLLELLSKLFKKTLLYLIFKSASDIIIY